MVDDGVEPSPMILQGSSALRRVPVDAGVMPAGLIPCQDSNLMPSLLTAGCATCYTSGECASALGRSRTCVPRFGRWSRIRWTTRQVGLTWHKPNSLVLVEGPEMVIRTVRIRRLPAQIAQVTRARGDAR